MTDSEGSEEELHDLDWGERDPFFDYNDPFALSPQISAVIENDVHRLKLLLESGKSANINDNNGNTPLHIAVLKDKVKVFDYLLGLDDVRIDAENFDGVTPLAMALICANEYFALELIRKGADVNVARNTGYTPLHYSVSNTLKVAQALILEGAEINVRSCLGETPLYVACERGNSDLVYMLLYFGADPSIPCCEGILPFTLALSKCSVDVQEILFEYTFGEGMVPTNLYTLEVAMTTNSSLFHRIVDKTSEVVYNISDLTHLSTSLPFVNTELFRVFMEKFEDVARDMFNACDSLTNYVIFLGTCIKESPDFVGFFYLLCDSPLVHDVVENYNPTAFLVHSIITRDISQDALTKLICCLISYGVSLTSDDLNSVYKHYGFCELFEIMLHVEIADCFVHNEEGTFETFIVPILIYDIHLDIDKCLEKPQKYIFPNNIYKLLKFFAHPKLREYCLKTFVEARVVDKIKVMPPVPSLVELSRNTARKYIIKRYKIKNCAQFFTVLKWLPINQFFKAIISYERELY